MAVRGGRGESVHEMHVSCIPFILIYCIIISVMFFTREYYMRLSTNLKSKGSAILRSPWYIVL